MEDGINRQWVLRERPTGMVEPPCQGACKTTFVVNSVGQYPKDAFPTDRVYGATKVPVLRLITCGGAFNFSTGHYTERHSELRLQSREESQLGRLHQRPLARPAMA